MIVSHKTISHFVSRQKIQGKNCHDSRYPIFVTSWQSQYVSVFYCVFSRSSIPQRKLMLKLHAFQGRTFESLLTFWLVWVGLYYWIVSVSVGGPQAHIGPRQRWHGIVAAHEVHVRRNMEQLRRAVSDTGMRGTYYSSKSMLWFRLEMSSLFENELKVLKNEYILLFS